MRVAVVGAGAIGCYIAAKLAVAGAGVVLLARGAALDTIRRSGVEVRGKEQISAPVRAVGSAAEAGPVDLVVSCVKAYSVPGIVPAVHEMLASDGVWLCAVNGLPWWYGEGLTGRLAGIALPSVDPAGGVAARIGRGRTVGCVLYVASEVLAPGVVSYTGGRGLIVGEPDGSTSERLDSITGVFRRAGIAIEATGDIRTAVWSKLFGNVSLNPLSAITGLTVDRILAEPALRRFLGEVIREVQHLADVAGCPPAVTPEARIEQMSALGTFRTSMLQDAEAGRPLEHDAIIGAVVDLGRQLEVPLPATDLLYAFIRSFAETRGLLPRLES